MLRRYPATWGALIERLRSLDFPHCLAMKFDLRHQFSCNHVPLKWTNRGKLVEKCRVMFFDFL